jgi:hypothetical protein
MRDLRHKIEAADFASLDDRYVACCDDYLHVVSVGVGDSVRTVHANLLADKPRALDEALDALHDLAVE